YYGGGALTNNGTVVSAGSIYGYDHALIQNAGLWQVLGDLVVSDGIGGVTNTFINVGTLLKSAGSGAAAFLWRFNTTGTINTDSGVLSVPQWTGNNTLHGTLNLSGSTTMNAPLTIAGDGVLNWSAGDLSSSLTIAPGGTLAVSNSVTIGYNYGNYFGAGKLT